MCTCKVCLLDLILRKEEDFFFCHRKCSTGKQMCPSDRGWEGDVLLLITLLPINKDFVILKEVLRGSRK